MARLVEDLYKKCYKSDEGCDKLKAIFTLIKGFRPPMYLTKLLSNHLIKGTKP